MEKNKDAVFFLLILFVIIGLAWGSKNNLKTVNQGSNPGSAQETSIEQDTGNHARSPYYGKINVSGPSGINSDDPNEELITLYTNLDEKEKVDITGWRLVSETTGNQAVIGQANQLAFPSKNIPSHVILQNGDVAYINKGYSPVGISFRANKCTGYFQEDRSFIPPLPSDCPSASDEKLPKFSSNQDDQEACLDAIDSMPSCKTASTSFLRDLPDTVSSSCKKYIETNINYNSCVANHLQDKDFYGHEYRLYLNSFAHLWRDYGRHEIINLFDQNGLLVDTIKN